MLALVTAEVAAPLDPDLGPLAAALRARLGDGAVEVAAWDDDAVDWARFDAAAIRSTWDYTDRLDEFLEWVERAGAATTLLNPAAAVRWSSDKRYLADLEAEGIAITPTTFVAPGDEPPRVEGLHVVKPTVGAGSNGARRCEPDEVADHVALLASQGRTSMVQPYLTELDGAGETCSCFVRRDGTWHRTHSFAKAAILTSTDVEREGDLFAKEQITPREPADADVALALATLETAAVGELGDLAFARVDTAPLAGPDGATSPVVMELELIEPSFFFDTCPGAVDDLADVLARRVGVGR